MFEPLMFTLTLMNVPATVTAQGERAKLFPSHWGEPPRRQTRDLVRWPAGFGRGSSTVAKWIKERMKEDGKSVVKGKKPKGVKRFSDLINFEVDVANFIKHLD